MKHFSHASIIIRTILQFKREAKLHKLSLADLDTYIVGTPYEFQKRLYCTRFIVSQPLSIKITARVVGMSLENTRAYRGGCILLEFSSGYYGHGGKGPISDVDRNYICIPHTTDSCWWVF